MAKLGEKIRLQRKKLKITRAALAEKLNLSTSAIAMYEGNRRVPPKNTLIKMSHILQIDIDYLENDEFEPIGLENTPIEGYHSDEELSLEQIADTEFQMKVLELAKKIDDIDEHQVSLQIKHRILDNMNDAYNNYKKYKYLVSSVEKLTTQKLKSSIEKEIRKEYEEKYGKIKAFNKLREKNTKNKKKSGQTG